MLVHPGESRTIQTIAQHFHWSSRAADVKLHVQLCATCQHYKKQCKKYGHLPVKTHRDLDPWEEVHVNLIGPWIVPQPPIKPSKPLPSPSTSRCKPITVLALTMIDPTTNFMELLALPDKESCTVICAFNCTWLCCYPCPLHCLHDKGTEFTGLEFQELLQLYGITPRITSSANPQTNSILERMHQVIANQLRSLTLMSLPLHTLANVQQDLLAPVQWALNATFHTTLQATPAQLAFRRDMIMPTSYLAHWHSLHQRRQALTDKDNAHENQTRIPHVYCMNDLVLVKQDAKGKLTKPT